MSPIDPLTATYRYTIDVIPDGPGDLGGTFGTLVVDGIERLRTWVVDAATDDFEADPCSCGSYGCGLRRVHVHRSGPYLVWTCWHRHHAVAVEYDELPPVLGAEAVAAVLGGSVDAHPALDAAHAVTLLSSTVVEDRIRWWEGDDPDLDAERLLAALAAPDPAWFVGATLVPCPSSVGAIIDEAGDVAARAAFVDGALAVQSGALGRFAVLLRLPAFPVAAVTCGSPSARFGAGPAR